MKTTAKMIAGMLMMSVIYFGVTSCEDSRNSTRSISPGSMNRLAADGSCVADTVTLWGGKTINEGNVIIWNDGTNLYVQYSVTNPGVVINDIHVWAGTDILNLPQNNSGIPVPGQFPYKFEMVNATDYLVSIPLADIILSTTEYCDQKVYVFTHAALSDGETAWGGNIFINATRWYYYYEYTICCGTVPPPPSYESETAFAKFSKADGGYVFVKNAKSNPEKYPTLNLTQNRWGWAANLSAGTYTAPVYAGAGLNIISNGTHVGNLTAVVTSSQVSLSYTLFSGFTMSEVHLYVSDAKPTTLAPGQYGHTVYFDPKVSTYSYTFNLSDLNGDGKFWIIAHAVANIPA